LVASASAIALKGIPNSAISAQRLELQVLAEPLGQQGLVGGARVPVGAEDEDRQVVGHLDPGRPVGERPGVPLGDEGVGRPLLLGRDSRLEDVPVEVGLRTE
jgi:hypothetical protein